MPVPHLEIRILQRSKGSSAVAGAAYLRVKTEDFSLVFGRIIRFSFQKCSDQPDKACWYSVLYSLIGWVSYNQFILVYI